MSHSETSDTDTPKTDGVLLPPAEESATAEARGDAVPAELTETQVAPPRPAAPVREDFVLRRSFALEAKLAFLVVAIFSVTALFWPKSDEVEAPSGLVADVTGEKFEVEKVMTRVTLVHFWSTWCPPCITETPSIKRMAADYADDDRFSLLMVAVADDVKKATDFLGGPENVGYFDDDWKLAKRYGTDKLPETHLVVDGEVVESFIGATDWDSAEVRQKITAALTSVRG